MGMKTSGVWALCLVLLSLTSMATALSPTTMKIQGSIFCLKNGNKVTPLPGAKARIECRTAGGAPFTKISNMANDRGFYTATASVTNWLVRCKAFLHASSQWGCRAPTDINGGRKGAPLIAFSPLSQSFSVKPFFYAPN